jgi:DNA-binding transcriptional LysR family regulator
MDFNQVRFFLAVADTLNFTRAAEQCNVTQPALTQSIKRLESELGGDLILRDGRNTELTKLGQTLRSHFQQIDRTRRLVRSTAKAVTSGELGELNIGLMCTIGPNAFSGLFKSFQTQYPNASVVLHDVTPESITDLLLSGAIDGAFCSRRGAPHHRIKYIDLFNEPIVVAFSQGHAFSKLDNVPLSAIADERYIDRLHCEFRGQFMQYCADQNLDLTVSCRSQREDWIQSLIRDGLGVSVIPKYSLLQATPDHRPISDPNMHRQIEFTCVEQPTPAPGLKAFIDNISQYDWDI